MNLSSLRAILSFSACQDFGRKEQTLRILFKDPQVKRCRLPGSFSRKESFNTKQNQFILLFFTSRSHRKI